MSGMFEALEASDQEQELQRREATNKLAEAIYDVKDQFGHFLFGSRDLEEYHDRLALAKNDIIKAIEPHMFPRTGTIRRVLKPIEREFKANLKTAAPEDEDQPTSVADMMGVDNPSAKPLTTNPFEGGSYDVSTVPGVQGGPNSSQTADPTGGMLGAPYAGGGADAPAAGDAGGGDSFYGDWYPGGGGDTPGAGGGAGGGTEGPAVQGPGLESTTDAWAGNGNTDAIGPGDYTVNEGDTLSSIADRAGISDYNTIADANESITDPNLIYTDSTINIPGAESPTMGPTIGEGTTPGPDTLGSDLNSDANTNPGLNNPPAPTTAPVGGDLKKGRRVAGDGKQKDLKTKSTFKPSSGELEPKGDFEGYLRSVDQGASSKVQRNFEKKSVKNFVAWCNKNKVAASLIALDRYSPRDQEYFVIAAALQRSAGKHDADPEKPWKNTVDDEPYRSLDGWPDFGDLEDGDKEYKGKHRAKDSRRRLETMGSVQRFASWCEANKVRPSLEALDSIKNVPDKDYFAIAAALQRAADNSDPSAPYGSSMDSSGNAAPASQVGIFGDGIGDPGMSGDGSARMAPGGTVTAPDSSFGGFGDAQNADVVGVASGNQQGLSAPQVQDPTGGIMSGPYGGTTARRRRRTAAPDYLQKANEALSNVLNQKAEEMQEEVAPLQQALQVVQQALQEQQAQNPFNVMPSSGTVDVMPGGGGGDPMGGGGAPPEGDPMAAMMGGGGGMPPGGGDPMGGGMPPEMGGGMPPGGEDPMAAMMGGGAPPGGGGDIPPELLQQLMASRQGRTAAGDGVFTPPVGRPYTNELSPEEAYAQALDIANAKEYNPAGEHSLSNYPRSDPSARAYLPSGRYPDPAEMPGGYGAALADETGARKLPGLPKHHAPQHRKSKRGGGGGELDDSGNPDELLEPGIHYMLDVPGAQEYLDEYAQKANRKRGGQGKAEAATRPRRESADVMNKWKSWQKKLPEQGRLPTGGESDFDEFAQENKVGPKGMKKLKNHLDSALPDDDMSIQANRRRAAPVKNPLAKPKPDYAAGAQFVNETVGNDPDISGEEVSRKWTREQGLDPKKEKAKRANRRRKQAWSGWGQPSVRKVAGWNWDHRLNGYITTAADQFSCDCGEGFDTPSGYRRCGSCGKGWNSYIIGTDNEGRQASLEKVIVREIPVREGVIVANKRVSQPSMGRGNLHPIWSEMGYTPEKLDEWGSEYPHLNSATYNDVAEMAHTGLLGNGGETGYEFRNPEALQNFKRDQAAGNIWAGGGYYSNNVADKFPGYDPRTGQPIKKANKKKACGPDCDCDDCNDKSKEARIQVTRNGKHYDISITAESKRYDISEVGGTPDDEGEDTDEPKLKSTTKDWYQRDQNQRWTK